MNWLKQTYVSFSPHSCKPADSCRRHQSRKRRGHTGADLWPRGHSVRCPAGADNPLYGIDQGGSTMARLSVHQCRDSDLLLDG